MILGKQLKSIISIRNIKKFSFLNTWLIFSFNSVPVYAQAKSFNITPDYVQELNVCDVSEIKFILYGSHIIVNQP